MKKPHFLTLLIVLFFVHLIEAGEIDEKYAVAQFPSKKYSITIPYSSTSYTEKGLRLKTSIVKMKAPLTFIEGEANSKGYTFKKKGV